MAALFHRRAMFAVLLPAIPFALPAQGREPLTQPASVPIELATALATAGGFGAPGEPQILVGAIPEWAANRMTIPDGARVLGSAFLGTTVIAVMALPSGSDSLVAQISGQLGRAGWRTPPQRLNQFNIFVPSRRATTQNTRRATLCGDGRILTVWTSRQQAAQSTVIMRLGAAQGFDPCNPPRRPDSEDGTPSPVLYDPENATDPVSSGFGAHDCANREPFGSASGGGTRLRTSMSAEAVLDHYGKQLVDSGWKATGFESVATARRWARSDSAGRPFIAEMTVTRASQDSTCRGVNLMIYRVRQ